MTKVFISHSSSDKDLFFTDLCRALQFGGHRVWFDTESMRIGDSISLGISEGLAESNWYVIGLSRAYLDSKWCKRELAAIIAESISRNKRMLIIRFYETEVPAILADVLYVTYASTDSNKKKALIESISNILSETYTNPHIPQSDLTPRNLVDLIFDANRSCRFGSDLLPSRTSNSSPLRAPQNEGVILIKPGGTFQMECLLDLFMRISSHVTIRQVRLFSGWLVERRNLFDEQYATSTKIAKGEIELTSEDRRKIAELYDVPDFRRDFGIPYSEELIVPALKLMERPYNLSADTLAELWEKGRTGGLFHNHKWNGLNKIGYQKSIFPIRLSSNMGVRLVVNGFIPGYRQLFVNSSARTIAIHASSNEPWRLIRDDVVGGDSDPAACKPGSIRRDAMDRLIRLDPSDNVVNGQRNVCHSSATLLDGMRELRLWFEYNYDMTVLGQVCQFTEFDLRQLEDRVECLPKISWSSRDDGLIEVLDDFRLRVTKDELRGSDADFKSILSDYANKIGVTSEALRGNSDLSNHIENSIRYRTAGEDLYLRCIARLFGNSTEKITFLEIARGIQSLVAERRGAVPPEAAAEAYRISAGDLMFLQCPAYREQIANPALFRASVVSELPEQSLECALRTKNNLLRDLRAAYTSGEVKEKICSIAESADWSEFTRHGCQGETTSQPIVAIVLCGGRSTRMASTIPKPILPLRQSLLFNSVRNAIEAATDNRVDLFAAVGFRARVIRWALGQKVRYLEHEKTLGLAFRVATALESLAQHEGLIIVAYTDMPFMSSDTIRQLVAAITDTRTFGLVETHISDLSGHLIKTPDGKIEVIQRRLKPHSARPTAPRDYGLYAFYNTQEFRTLLGRVRNDNSRGEFIFADVVKLVSESGWKVVTVEERNEGAACGVNTSSELLTAALKPHRRNIGDTELAEMIKTLSSNYCLRVSIPSATLFESAVKEHKGPFHFFHWWDDLWQGHS